jgi:hypothetical protein
MKLAGSALATYSVAIEKPGDWHFVSDKSFKVE